MGNGINSTIVSSTVFTPQSTVPTAHTTSIQNLLVGNKWGGAIGLGVDLTFSFSNYSSKFNYSISGMSELKLMTSVQQNVAINAMNAWSNIANITFTQVSDTGSSAGDIRLSASTSNKILTMSEIVAPNTASNGDIWIGPNFGGYNSAVRGSYSFATYIHELGHTLGLDHPNVSLILPISGEDQLKYSIMSYRSFVGDNLSGTYGNSFFPTTPMLNDIATIQYLYRANKSYKMGNDTYSWINGQSIFETIWDAGGNDTIDASNQSQGVLINLNSGQWSQIGKEFWNGQSYVRDCLTIAYETVIENVIGSKYNDTLIGNNYANTLNGGIGIDKMQGGAGNDTYYVDNIGDKVYETTSTANTTDAGGTDKVISSISYTLGNFVENLQLNSSSAINGTGNTLNNTIYSGTGNNIIDGRDGTDTLSYAYAISSTTTGVKVSLAITSTQATGISGSDTIKNFENLTGSKYNDTLTGDSSANTLNGLAGNNTLVGGAGKDKFVFNTTLNTSTNKDTIKDFRVDDDTILLENAIFTKLTKTGTLNTTNFVSNTTGKAVDINDYLIYNKGTGQLFYDTDGSGTAKSTILFATIENKANLTYSDFTVI